MSISSGLFLGFFLILVEILLISIIVISPRLTSILLHLSILSFVLNFLRSFGSLRPLVILISFRFFFSLIFLRSLFSYSFIAMSLSLTSLFIRFVLSLNIGSGLLNKSIRVLLDRLLSNSLMSDCVNNRLWVKRKSY